MAPTTKKKIKPSERLKDPQQEYFCLLYAYINTRECFGNASKSYLEAYGGQKEIDQLEVDLQAIPDLAENRHIRLPKEARIKQLKNSSRSASSQLLAKLNISGRCSHLLSAALTDKDMDNEMSYVIKQRFDLQSKVQAYNAIAKVKNRFQETNVNLGPVTFQWKGDNRKKPDQTNLPTTTRKAPEARTKKGKFTIKSSS